MSERRLRVFAWYQLGEAIGEGASSVVCEAVAHHPKVDMRDIDSPVEHPSSESTFRLRGSLAVKMVKHSDHDHEQLAMWETHVLQQLNHKNISRLRDIIDLVDATYIIMERVEGPELGDYIASQPEGRLRPSDACRIFCQMLSAIRYVPFDIFDAQPLTKQYFSYPISVLSGRPPAGMHMRPAFCTVISSLAISV